MFIPQTEYWQIGQCYSLTRYYFLGDTIKENDLNGDVKKKNVCICITLASIRLNLKTRINTRNIFDTAKVKYETAY